jgi:CheY-like chemotaxis protein
MKKNFELIKHLVIADDDLDDQILVKEIVKEYSPKTKTTCLNDGKQLMDWLNLGGKPDLILLDLNMPYKTGPQCLNEIRSDHKLKTLPVIILSTSRNKRDIDLCYKSGADLFYSKPWNMDDSKSLIQSILAINWNTFKTPLDFDVFLKMALGNKGMNSF